MVTIVNDGNDTARLRRQEDVLADRVRRGVPSGGPPAGHRGLARSADAIVLELHGHAMTRMRDDFSFESPCGPAGRVFDSYILRRHMHAQLDYRARYIKRVAESDDFLRFLRATSNSESSTMASWAVRSSRAGRSRSICRDRGSSSDRRRAADAVCFTTIHSAHLTPSRGDAT
jgi:hypothetical protein